jgi:hypothetical protein
MQMNHFTITANRSTISVKSHRNLFFALRLNWNVFLQNITKLFANIFIYICGVNRRYVYWGKSSPGFIWLLHKQKRWKFDFETLFQKIVSVHFSSTSIFKHGVELCNQRIHVFGLIRDPINSPLQLLHGELLDSGKVHLGALIGSGI